MAHVPDARGEPLDDPDESTLVHGLHRRTGRLDGVAPADAGTRSGSTHQPADVPTTLRETIRQSTTGNKAYRTLRTAAGEPFIARTDLMTGAPAAGRVGQRRSLGYFGHTSDIHVQDTQSPSRLEPTNAFSPTLFPGTQAAAGDVIVRPGPDGAGLQRCRLQPGDGCSDGGGPEHGDSADQISNLETRWYIRIMDGVPVMADSGTPGSTRAWRRGRKRPMPTTRTIRAGTCGALRLPSVPGLLEAVVTTEVTSPGMPAPWYSVFRQPRRPVQRIRRQDDSCGRLLPAG